MTDVRTRLADALRGQLRPLGFGPSAILPDRIADALLSVPGIAIVELPEGFTKEVIDDLVIALAFFASEQAPQRP